MEVKLNFINKSKDTNNSDVFIFQKDVAPDSEEIVIAWKVIRNCGPGESHPFVFPWPLSVAAMDRDGNYTPTLEAKAGYEFQMVRDASGNMLKYLPLRDIQLYNHLPSGAITALVHRDGKLLAMRKNVIPGEKAVFHFRPVLYIGVAAEITEESPLSPEIVSDVDAEISLLGVHSANIVMTGGGATPFIFSLENIEEG